MELSIKRFGLTYGSGRYFLAGSDTLPVIALPTPQQTRIKYLAPGAPWVTARKISGSGSLLITYQPPVLQQILGECQTGSLSTVMISCSSRLGAYLKYRYLNLTHCSCLKSHWISQGPHGTSMTLAQILSRLLHYPYNINATLIHTHVRCSDSIWELEAIGCFNHYSCRGHN
jgi:hypothetical protein